MKVLFIPSLTQPFVFPATHLRGGLEKVELDQLSALLSLGIEVTVACPADAVVSSEVPHVHTSVISKHGQGEKGAHYYMDHLNEIHALGLMDSHDVILFNQAPNLKTSSSVLKWLPSVAHKFRVVMHEADVHLVGARQTVGRIGWLKYLVANGGRCATVQENGQELFAELEESFRSGRYFAKETEAHSYELDTLGSFLRPFTDFYEVMVVGDDFLPVETLSACTGVSFVGRPVNYKGFRVAALGAQLAGFGDYFVGHTMSPSKGQETKDWIAAERIQDLFKVGASHADVMVDVANSHVFLQPTKSESAGGIVTFEAAAHGVPSVTSTTTGRRYLEPYGLYNFIEKRTAKEVAEAIKAVKPLSTEQRQEVARQVRSDFSFASYAARLKEFLS